MATWMPKPAYATPVDFDEHGELIQTLCFLGKEVPKMSEDILHSMSKSFLGTKNEIPTEVKVVCVFDYPGVECSPRLSLIANNKVKLSGLLLRCLKIDIMFIHLSELAQPPEALRKRYYGSLVASAKFSAAVILLSFNEMLSALRETKDVSHSLALSNLSIVRQEAVSRVTDYPPSHQERSLR
ncbi:hypothetical protein BTVI_98397 [Pitangus sulphuratus]|nr:hypothetical protein BTVI_98397 [Pitangus sulphuratus]